MIWRHFRVLSCRFSRPINSCSKQLSFKSLLLPWRHTHFFFCFVLCSVFLLLSQCESALQSTQHLSQRGPPHSGHARWNLLLQQRIPLPPLRPPLRLVCHHRAHGLPIYHRWPGNCVRSSLMPRLARCSHAVCSVSMGSFSCFRLSYSTVVFGSASKHAALYQGLAPSPKKSWYAFFLHPPSPTRLIVSPRFLYH